MLKKITLFIVLMLMVLGSYAVSITSIARQSPSSSITNSATLVWRVNFGSGTLVNAANNTSAFKVIITSGSATSTISSVTLVSGNTYDVTVSSVSVSSANAVLRLDLKSNTYTGITRGGSAVDTFSTGQTYTVDQTAPAIGALSAPNSAFAYNGTVNIIYNTALVISTYETPKSNTVTIKFTDISTSALYTFVVLGATATGNFSFNINNPNSPPANFFTAPSSLPTGTYNVTMTYQDQAGNQAPTVTQNNVLINNQPVLIGSTSIPAVCDNSLNNHINVNLRARDLDNGQTLNWTVLQAPSNGTLNGFPYSTTSVAGALNPIGLSYSPDPLYIGNDTFVIGIDDGAAGGTSSQTFYVTVNETKAYYRDIDADTYGDINQRSFVCTGNPVGYVLDSSDCNDNAVTMHDKFNVFYADADIDGYGAGSVQNLCAVDATTPPSGYSIIGTDCDDTQDTVWQSGSLHIDSDHDGYDVGIATVCYGTRALLGYAFSSLASDCDDADATKHATYSFYVDGDFDTYGSTNTSTLCAVNASTPPSTGYVINNTDCDDTEDSVWVSGSLYIDVDHDGYDNGTATVCYGTRALLGYAFTSLASDCNDADNTKHATYPFYIDADLDTYGSTNTSTLCAVNASTPPSTGYSINNTDCNDLDITVNTPQRYFADVDGDTYGDNASVSYLCFSTAPSGYSSDSTDCNDNAFTKHATFNVFYTDADNDGYGAGITVSNVCAVNATTPPTYYSINNSDCNDADSTVNTPQRYFADVDGDTYGDNASVSYLCFSTAPTGYSSDSTDCDDNVFAKHATFNVFYTDADNDGYGAGSIVSNVCAVNATTPPTLYSLNNTDCNDGLDSVWQSGLLKIDADGDRYDNGTATVCYGSHVLSGYAFTSLGTDCNDAIDSVWQSGLLYIDADHDGYNNGQTTKCYGNRALLGFALTTSGVDCDDNNALLTHQITYYLDSDGDTYGDNDNTKDTCSLTPPVGYVANNTDCDDANNLVNSNSLIVNVSITIYPSVIAYTGHSVTLTAASTNGGSASYQWFKNNIPVATSSANTYTYIPANGDVIKCVLTSSLKCTISPTDTSNAISIIVTNPPAISNDYPCGAINCSANSGHIAGLPTVVSAYDNGGAVYGGLDNSRVDNNPPYGPSMVYYNVNCTAAGSIGDPTSTCQLGGSQNSVWYKFKAPSYTAGITIRSKLSYGQLFIPTLTAYAITAGTACNAPVFSEIQCSSSGVLALSAATLTPYVGQYIYLMVQNTSTEPICNYVVSIQGIVPDILLSNPTTTTIDVNFPTFTAPAPTKYTLYWRKVGTNGASYINITPTATYTIGGLISGNNYDVWVKYSNASTGGTSSIYSSKQTLGTTIGCGGNLPAPTITANGSHCASVYANWTNPPASIPSGLLTPLANYPYRLIWMIGNRGNVQALQTIPSSGYYIGNLTMAQAYNIFYSYKCVGGATMYSAITNYTTCFGTPRLANTEHHEYIINNIHYVDVDMEELIAAATTNLQLNDEQIHEFTLQEVVNDNTDDNIGNASIGNFDLSPNPATNNVVINYNFDVNGATIKYQILDIQGKLVVENNINEAPNTGSINIDVTTFEQGVYLVTLQANGYTSTKRLVITK